MPRKAITLEWHEPVLRIYPVGDVHIGSEACDEDAAARLAEIIAGDKLARIIGVGDFIEAIAPTDRRFMAAELSKPISQEHIDNPFYTQSLRFCKIFEPTRGKWLGVNGGNHESSATSHYFFDPIPIIAERLGCPHHLGNDQGGWYRVKMIEGKSTRSMADIFAMHGSGSGELRGADALRLERMLGRKGADVCIIGHGHKPMAIPVMFEALDKYGTELSSMRWGVECFPLCGKHGYVAQKGGNSSPIGYHVIELHRQHDGPTKISVRMEVL
jgi:predicted phosphodiesterase